MKQVLALVAAMSIVISLDQNCSADVVELDDGSKVVGRITGIVDGKYQIETGFAGTITINPAKVHTVVTDNPINIALKSGNTLVGQLDFAGEQRRVRTVNGIVGISGDEVLALWLEGQENPLTPKLGIPEKRKWKYDATVDIRGKTGNSERIATAGGFTAVLPSPQDKLKVYAKGDRSKENSVKTVEEIKGGIDYEAFFAGKSSWYARVELETDEIELIDLRTTAALGYGQYFIKKDDHELRGRAGLQLRHESFIEDSTGFTKASSTDPGFDFGLHHMYRFDDWGKWVTDVSYTPTFDDFQNFRLDLDTYLEVPLVRSKLWKLRTGLTNEYNNLPAPNTKHHDTTYFAAFVLSWD